MTVLGAAQDVSVFTGQAAIQFIAFHCVSCISTGNTHNTQHNHDTSAIHSGCDLTQTCHQVSLFHQEKRLKLALSSTGVCIFQTMQFLYAMYRCVNIRFQCHWMCFSRWAHGLFSFFNNNHICSFLYLSHVVYKRPEIIFKKVVNVYYDKQPDI